MTTYTLVIPYHGEDTLPEPLHMEFCDEKSLNKYMKDNFKDYCTSKCPYTDYIKVIRMSDHRRFATIFIKEKEK